MTLIEDLSNLFLPARCVLCGRLPKSICQDCWIQIPFSVRQVSKRNLFGFAICDYAGSVADLLIAFKDRGQVQIGKLLADQIPKSIAKPLVDIIVFAPSSKKNFGTRGFVPAQVIAKRIAKAWRLPVMSISLAQIRYEQSELGRNRRLDNLVGRMTLLRPMLGRKVLLVDDIVTTGATLTEMARAVQAAGGQVAGFITVAETLPKSPRSF